MDELHAISDELDKIARDIEAGRYNPDIGRIVSFVSKRGRYAGERIHCILIEKKGRRWRVWVWNQQTDKSTRVSEGGMTIPIQMIEDATRDYTDKERLEFLERGYEEWGGHDTARKERSQKRRERSQQRYERSLEWEDKLKKGETYYWPKGSYSMNEGTFTGIVKDGKAKMQPVDPLAMFGGRNRKRAVWVLLDRLYRQYGNHYSRMF